ncbi:MAG TPA: 16S rRNA (adenine(1518)-N(6)/adenine(1519)-N(6))-dimethyltransferase RsmA [Acidimicrobiia bacterium]|nr:16S rRNA (adenine(1518)-N(6)/adenine(1519)-N(6))-dimethyltransferase RsmA [Acidimicrobiia bacterium]
MKGQSRREILGLLEKYDLRPRKEFGQHFLADRNLIDKIVATAEVGGEDKVVEVGAGTGALTVALADTGARVIAYEVDERMRPVLEEVLAGTTVDLRYEDALEVDLQSVLADDGWKLVANLPYNVGTPLVMDVLLRVPAITSLTIMLQKEVADRLVAAPGSSDYGLPSVVVAFTARVVERFTVPPQVFVPPPQVSSGVLRLDRVEPPPGFETALSLARRAFGQRRKMLRRSLEGVVTEDAFAAAGVSGESRPETLSASEFLALAKEVSDG